MRVNYEVVKRRRFTRSAKRTQENVALEIHRAIAAITENPRIGIEKKSDLDLFRVHKFKVLDNTFLLAYLFDEEAGKITLVAVGPHENFYRDLKR